MTLTAPVTPSRPAAAPTRRALAVVVAWPLWSTVSLVGVATRPGFDLTRHPLSALSTGAAGWVQIANFVVTGLLLVVGASGLTSSRWVSRLVRGTGVGMIAAGALVMDPMAGFPLGAASSATLSWHAAGHMAAGTLTFALMIAASYVWARRLRRAGRRGLAAVSVAAGTALLLGDGWATMGAPLGSLTIAIGAIACGLWISVAAAIDVQFRGL